MATVTLLVFDQLALQPGETRWRDLIVARGDTPRILSGSPSLSSMTTSAAMVIIAAGTSVTTLAQLADANIPIICADSNKFSNIGIGSGSASPPNVAFWRVAPGVTNSPFLPGFGANADINIWNSDSAHRHAGAAAPGAQVLATYPGNTSRIFMLYMPTGGQLNSTSPSPNKRLGIALLEATLGSSAYTSVTGTLMGAAYDQMMGGTTPPPPASVVVDAGPDQTLPGGSTFTATATVSSGVPPFTYEWDNPSGTSLTFFRGETSQTVHGVVSLVGGTGRLDVSAIDANAATGTDFLNIISTPKIRTGFISSTLATGWSTSNGTTAHSVVDRLSSTNDVFLTSPEGTGGASQTIKIATLPGTVRTSGLSCYVECDLTASVSTATITVALLEGSTIRATGSVTPTLNRTRPVIEFTAGSLASIVDLSNCFLRLTTSLVA